MGDGYVAQHTKKIRFKVNLFKNLRNQLADDSKKSRQTDFPI